MKGVHAIRGLVKLTGTISNYKCTRAQATFVFTDADRTKLRLISIAAGLADLSGPAISTAASATRTEEIADFVEFDLNDEPVKGWLWRSPFKNGDVVEVAAEWQSDHYEIGGIARPIDRLIALCPHCSRGVSRHIKNAFGWWFGGVLVWLAVLLLMSFVVFGAKNVGPMIFEGFHYVILGSYLFFGLMTFSLARKWLPFARLSEKVFITLGFPDPSNLDLVKSSKSQRRPDDPGEYGTFYFRY